MKLFKIEAGTYKCDGGAVFGVVPKKVWKKRYPYNDDNQCPLAMRCLLLEVGDRKILIETGMGAKQLDYFKHYDPTPAVNFESELNKLGYACDDITDVILTHLHFDHCGGCTYYKDNNRKELALTFQNATHWVSESQWNNYLAPNVREGNSFFLENMMPVVEAGKLKLVTENQHVSSELELRLFNGHTVGQLVCYIYEKKYCFVYVGDVIPLAASIPLAWVSAYDVNPLCSMEEKEVLLKEAVEKKQILFFEHDAVVECCTVKCVDGKYSADELFEFKDLCSRTSCESIS